MRVATRMAEAYRSSPYGLVVHTGDLVYYGSLTDRFEDVYLEPFGPLLDAGVDVQPVLGNHEFDHAESLRLLEILGMPGRHYTFTSGPVEFFMLDSTPPAFEGDGARPRADGWRNVSHGRRRDGRSWCSTIRPTPPAVGAGPSDATRARAVPRAVRRGPRAHRTRSSLRALYRQGRWVHVVSGGGAKLTSVGRSWFTEVSAKRLHFMIIDVDQDTLAALDR